MNDTESDLDQLDIANSIRKLVNNGNDHRAYHKVNFVPYSGFNVQIPYKGYMISLASDGEDTLVFEDLEPQHLYRVEGTSGKSIKKAIKFIDRRIKSNKG